MLRHFYCPVGSFMQFYLCVGSVFALFNSVGWSLVDIHVLVYIYNEWVRS